MVTFAAFPALLLTLPTSPPMIYHLCSHPHVANPKVKTAHSELSPYPAGWVGLVAFGRRGVSGSCAHVVFEDYKAIGRVWAKVELPIPVPTSLLLGAPKKTWQQNSQKTHVSERDRTRTPIIALSRCDYGLRVRVNLNAFLPARQVGAEEWSRVPSKMHVVGKLLSAGDQQTKPASNIKDDHPKNKAAKRAKRYEKLKEYTLIAKASLSPPTSTVINSRLVDPRIQRLCPVRVALRTGKVTASTAALSPPNPPSLPQLLGGGRAPLGPSANGGSNSSRTLATPATRVDRKWKASPRSPQAGLSPDFGNENSPLKPLSTAAPSSPSSRHQHPEKNNFSKPRKMPDTPETPAAHWPNLPAAPLFNQPTDDDEDNEDDDDDGHNQPPFLLHNANLEDTDDDDHDEHHNPPDHHHHDDDDVDVQDDLHDVVHPDQDDDPDDVQDEEDHHPNLLENSTVNHDDPLPQQPLHHHLQNAAFALPLMHHVDEPDPVAHGLTHNLGGSSSSSSLYSSSFSSSSVAASASATATASSSSSSSSSSSALQASGDWPTDSANQPAPTATPSPPLAPLSPEKFPPPLIMPAAAHSVSAGAVSKDLVIAFPLKRRTLRLPPEILGCVLKFAYQNSRRQFLNNALVCKVWASSALPVLWERIAPRRGIAIQLHLKNNETMQRRTLDDFQRVVEWKAGERIALVKSSMETGFLYPIPPARQQIVPSIIKALPKIKDLGITLRVEEATVQLQASATAFLERLVRVSSPSKTLWLKLAGLVVLDSECAALAERFASGLRYFLQRAPKLQSLALYIPSLQDQLLGTIAHFNHQLQDLWLDLPMEEGGAPIGDTEGLRNFCADLRLLLRQSSKLRRLRLRGVPLPPDRAQQMLEVISTEGTEIRSLSILVWPPTAMGSGIERVSFSSLSKLIISSNSRLSADFILAVARSCPLLAVLDAGRTRIDDTCIAELALRCRNLETLDVSRCTLPTTASLERLATHSSRLRTLDVSYCPKILRASSVIAFVHLAERCLEMGRLIIDYPPESNDTSEGVRMLVARFGRNVGGGGGAGGAAAGPGHTVVMAAGGIAGGAGGPGGAALPGPIVGDRRRMIDLAAVRESWAAFEPRETDGSTDDGMLDWWVEANQRIMEEDNRRDLDAYYGMP
ncbi:hypothetical protein BDK51DRAFT_28603 [Blyttiomyces helicus]|uniref:Uncharacterized protein n=1 Tax=Blyttiomyces helicus TaxID=388810 RepID=A0A4P9WFJ4_9FUNG|nr:hypothetical protein BDK51DRAFT_28603 [Blyttiomyces helicus]|eukprot:RKO91531.1 hypothetical protein BDK51DRAFT_28603 [Blyttiomyces helicus]